MNTSVVHLLIALALLGSVPLGTRLLGVGTPPCAARVVAVLSMLLPTGPGAGLLASVWLVSALRLVWLQRRSAITTLVTLAWLPAAATWLACDRFGVRPLDFDSSIVVLTAAHFHHAGFGISALLAHTRATRGLWIHQAGMVTVAIGITASDRLEPIGAALVVVALLFWAAAALRARRQLTGWRRGAIIVSGVAWTYPMLLALRWAIAPLGWTALAPFTRGLNAMVAQHGAVNAIAVVLLGLVALTPATIHPIHDQELNHADVATA